jgi:hypothetical protein
MSLYSPRPTFASVLRSFGSTEGMPFTEALTEPDIEMACAAEGVCSRVSCWKKAWTFSGWVDTCRAWRMSPSSSRSEMVIGRAC